MTAKSANAFKTTTEMTSDLKKSQWLSSLLAIRSGQKISALPHLDDHSGADASSVTSSHR